MIKKTALAALLVRLGAAATEEKANELINATEEHDVSIPEGTRIYSKTEWEGDGTEKNPGVENKLKNIGKELQIKDLKEKTGISYEGKDPNKFVELYKEALTKAAESSTEEKVKSRDTTIQQLKKALEEKDTENTGLKRSLKSINEDNQLISMLPKNRDPKFSDKHYLMALRADLEFTEEDGVPVVKKNGQVIKNDKIEPISYADAISGHFKEANWLMAEEGGEGGGSGFGGGRNVKEQNTKPLTKFANMKEVNTYLEKENIPAGSEKATQIIQQALKDNPEMDTRAVA